MTAQSVARKLGHVFSDEALLKTALTHRSFGTPNNVTVVGRIKLVNPAENELVRGDDGLFRTRNREPAPIDENVKLAPEALEGSNVNSVDAMVNMISLARQFEMQIKMLQMADANAGRATQLLSNNR